MTKMVENQRSWDDFQITRKVGVICTYFSEQYLDESFEIVKLTPENFQEEIELNGIATIFIDNDIYETDHIWYKKDRSNLFRYFRNENRRHYSKNIVVIKNSNLDVGTIFRNSFVLDIDLGIDTYYYQKYQFKVPLQINYQRFNPSSNLNQKTIDVVNLSFENNNNKSSMFDNDTFSVKNVRIKNLSRKILNDLISNIMNSRILYINPTKDVDSKFLKYIQVIAILSSTTIINKTLESNSTNFEKYEKIKYLLRNKYCLWENIIEDQRSILIKHTSVMTRNFYEFMVSKNTLENTPKISVITVTNRKTMLENYFAQMNSQEHVLLDLIVVLDGFNLSESEKNYFHNKTLFKINFLELSKNESLGHGLNKAVSYAEYSYIAKIDDDDFYGKNYIIDQWLSLKYSNANMVGKSDTMYYFEQDDTTYLNNKNQMFEYTNSLSGSTIFTYRKLLKEIPFADLPKAIEINLIRRVINNGLKVFSTHPFGMCVLRKSDKTQHLLKADDIILKNTLSEFGFGIPKKYVDI